MDQNECNLKDPHQQRQACVLEHPQIIRQIEAIPLSGGRRLIAIAGAPASGKSTLAEALAKQMQNACVLPMDGFHRDNDDLIRHDLLERKGAPETFDVAGFSEVLGRLRTTKEVPYPTFDRTNDRVVPDGGTVMSAHKTILVEGNYLLFTQPPWDGLTGMWDFSILLDVPLVTLEQRLIQRWLDHGYDQASAEERARGNDLRNANLMMENLHLADLTIRQS